MPEIRPAVHCSQDLRRFDQTWFVLLGKMLCDDNDDGDIFAILAITIAKQSTLPVVAAEEPIMLTLINIKILMISHKCLRESSDQLQQRWDGLIYCICIFYIILSIIIVMLVSNWHPTTLTPMTNCGGISLRAERGKKGKN